MAGTLKKVRFIRPYQNYRVGDVITPSGALRDVLKDRGYIEIIDDNGSVRAKSVNRMVTPPQRRAAGHVR